MEFINYYAILGVSRDAGFEEIRKQYHKLLHDYHPDVSKDENASQKTALLIKAYTVLKDATARRMYDLEYDEHFRSISNKFSSGASTRYSGVRSSSVSMTQKVNDRISEALEKFDYYILCKDMIVEKLAHYSANPTAYNMQVKEWLMHATKYIHKLENLRNTAELFGLDSNILDVKIYSLCKSMIELKIIHERVQDELVHSTSNVRSRSKKINFKKVNSK